MATTSKFGLNAFGPEGSLADDGYKFSLRDRLTIDALLWALFNHDHRATEYLTVLAGPQGRPVLTTGAGGSFQAGKTYYYRVSYMDEAGNETEASISSSVTTPAPIAPPETQLIEAETIGGTLAGGTYRYALAYYQTGGYTTRAPNDFLVVMPDTATGAITITLDAPPADADGWHIYRRSPLDDDYYYLTAVAAPAATFVDDGSLSPDCTKKRPAVNNTNTNNKITIDLDPADLPLDERVTAWRIYRSNNGIFGASTLLATVTMAGSVLATTYDDLGLTTVTGAPLDASAVPPPIKQLDASDAFGSSSGYLPATARPQGVSQFHSFLPGTLAAAKYAQTTPPVDMRLHRIDAWLLTGPTGVDGANHPTIRFKDLSTQNEIHKIWNDAVTVNEIQAVYTDATSGTFTLTFGANTTAAIAFDATPEDLATALEALASITDVLVTGSGTAADPWYVEFVDPGDQDVALMTFDDTGLTGGTVFISEYRKGSNGGTFTLGWDGSVTAALAYDISAAALETAIEGLTGITAVTVTGTGTEADPWLVEYVTPGSQFVPLLYFDDTLLNGTCYVERETEGYAATIVDLDLDAVVQGFSWVAPDSTLVVEEAEDMTLVLGSQVADIAALNDIAVELDPTGTATWNPGVLPAATYYVRVYLAALEGYSTCDILVSNLLGGGTGSGDLLAISFAADRGEYEPYFLFKFASTGVEDVEIQIKNTAVANAIRLDRVAYEAELPVFHADQLFEIEVVVTGAPTTNGDDAQVSLWY